MTVLTRVWIGLARLRLADHLARLTPPAARRRLGPLHLRGEHTHLLLHPLLRLRRLRRPALLLTPSPRTQICRGNTLSISAALILVETHTPPRVALLSMETGMSRLAKKTSIPLT